LLIAFVQIKNSQINPKAQMFFVKYVLTLVLFVLIIHGEELNNSEIIVDSSYSLEECLNGSKAPDEVKNAIVLLDVMYYSDDGKLHQGQLLVHKDVVGDVSDIFAMMLERQFVVHKVIPIHVYDWSDDKSMEDNNTSAFNYRFIAGTNRLSNHSFGRAVDINPKWNPVVHKNGRLSPANGRYDVKAEGTFYENHPIVKEFKKRGWRWGGNFTKYADNHHFDYPK